MDTLRIGVVGCAGRGGSFLNTFNLHPQTMLHALCDIDEEGLQERGSQMDIPGKRLFTDYERMLEEGGVDIVLIGTPMPLHAPQSIMALNHGVHVLSEVPAAVNMQEARELVQACADSDATYMMAENYTYMKPNVLVRELARRGLFGEMYFGEGEYLHELKELNEITPWRRKWQTGINGVTYPTHSLGPVLQWMDDRVVSVCCAGSGHHYTDPRGDQYENEDSILMLCRMSGGGLVKIRVDMLSDRPHNMTYYSLQGTAGVYEADRGLDDEPKIWLRELHGDDPEWHPLSELEAQFMPEIWKNPPEAALKAGHGGGDYFEIMDFVEAISTGTPPPIHIHDAMDMT
ncbi:MAG: Gfo/Idh/MocA family protein, partial [Armatimonadota bacterium]